MYGQPSRGGGGHAPLSTGVSFNQIPNLYYSQSPNIFLNLFQNPYLQYQNPSLPFQIPNFHFQAQHSTPPTAAVERIDQAVLKARREILATGEAVSAWKVSQAALVILQADTWDSLGFQMQQVPSLHRLILTEGKINTFIHCFVGARRITTLHDLEIALCNTEGVERFEDLELGPLVKHPLIIHYFSLSADVTEVCKITSEEIVSLLSVFMNTNKQRKVEIEQLLDFIAKKQSVTAKEMLGVRIQSLGMHITLIRQAWQLEITTMTKYLERLTRRFSKKTRNRPLLSSQKKQMYEQSKRKRKYCNIQSPFTSPQKVRKTERTQTPVSRKEWTKSYGKKNKWIAKQESTDSIDCSYCNIQSPLTLPQKVRKTERTQTPVSRKERTKSSGKKNKWIAKQESTDSIDCSYCHIQSPLTSPQKVRKTERTQTPVSRKERTKSSGKKNKWIAKQESTDSIDCSYCHIQSPLTSPQKVRKTERTQTPVSRKERTKSSGKKNKWIAKQESTDSIDCSYGSDSMKLFITTWKEACQANSVDEVFEKMMQFYRTRKKATARKLFSSYPFVVLLHIAVTSIKNGMWDSMYGTFQSLSQLEVANTVSENCSDFISIDVESSRRNVSSLPQKHPLAPIKINYEGIIEERSSGIANANFTPAGVQLTGRLGEFVAFEYFIKVGNPLVKWVNETFETGLPYDLVVGDNEYIEVKATKNVRKDWFSISAREWQFAVEKGELYSVAHVVLSDTNTARVTIYKNPAKLVQLGKLQLAITIIN